MAIVENAKDYRDDARIARGNANAVLQREAGIDPEVGLIENLGKVSPWDADNLNEQVARQKALLRSANYLWEFPCLVDLRTGKRLRARKVQCRTKFGPTPTVSKWCVTDDDDKAIAWIPLAPLEPMEPETVDDLWTDRDRARDPASYEIVLRDFKARHRSWQKRMERWESKYGVRMGSEMAPARVKVIKGPGRKAVASDVRIVRTDGR